MLSEIVEEGDDIDETRHFSEFVDPSNAPPDEYRPPAPPPPSGGKKSPPPSSGSPSTAENLKTFSEVDTLLLYNKKRDVKTIIRENDWPIRHSIRGKLWPKLCHGHSTEKTTIEEPSFYWELVNQLFGNTELPDKIVQLPQFVEMEHRHTFFLNKKGVKVADRVVCVLGFSCPDITYSPMVYPIAALLLHYMTEEQCYSCLATLVACKSPVFLHQTKLLHEVTWRTVMHITKKHVKSAAATLSRHCPTSRAERIYTDWIWWVLHNLPFNHVVRVMDCYLNEGIKVLYRVAMAILLLFHKNSASWTKDIAESGVDSALAKFANQIPVGPRKLLRVCFGIRGLSSAYIFRVFTKTEMTLKARSNVMSNSRQLIRSRSSENLPTSQSQLNVQMMSHTLTIRELFTLWSWLPVRITMYQPILLYTTEEHGCSLQTFYVRVEQHEPTLLLIKTNNNEVFGAYCSSRWIERNQKDERGNRVAYFGTGETFLFSLYPERAKYSWVGVDESKSHVKHSAELFMAADAKMITVGGGDGQAIWMDENIRYGKTDSCLTFNNPPLCRGRDFEIKVLEVYGFGTS
uniref:TBC1 domain family member 24 n=2 Tax=Lygus hesperus TaxID=30085 RepID=A0A0K8STK2_LYGHE